MPEFNNPPQQSLPQVDMGFSTALLQSGSPKGVYTYFLLSLAKNFFECASHGDSFDLDHATAALIAFTPSREVRRRLWEEYTTHKRNGETQITASVYVVGELISHLSDLLEFEEQSTGGLM